MTSLSSLIIVSWYSHYCGFFSRYYELSLSLLLLQRDLFNCLTIFSSYACNQISEVEKLHKFTFYPNSLQKVQTPLSSNLSGVLSDKLALMGHFSTNTKNAGRMSMVKHNIYKICFI